MNFSLKKINAFICISIWFVMLGMYAEVARSTPPETMDLGPSEMQMRVYSNIGKFPRGQAFLIPRPLKEIKAILQSKPAWFEGFQKRGVESQFLSEEEIKNEWTKIYYQYHPQTYKESKQARLKKLDEVVAKKGITADERRDWGMAIQNETVAEINSEIPDAFIQKISREEFVKSFSGRRGLKMNEFRVEEYVVLLDVAPFLDQQSPLTLVWHGGVETLEKRTTFEWSACMTGVTCFPFPHWETTSTENTSISPAVRKSLSDLAIKFDALPVEQVRRLRDAFDMESRNSIQEHELLLKTGAEVPLRSFRAAVVDSTLHPLPGTLDPKKSRQPIKALADGRFFSNIGGQILERTAAGVGVRKLSTEVELSASRVDGKGQLWGLAFKRQERTPDTVCLVRLDAERLTMHRQSQCINSVMFPNWLMTSQGRAVLYAASSPTSKSRWIDLADENSSVEAEDFFRSRQEAIDVTPLMAGSLTHTIDTTLDLGDGLFWFGSNGLIGVSPKTGKAQKSFPGVKGGDAMSLLVFGSAAGNWFLRTATASNHNSVLRVHRLTDGLPLYDLPADRYLAAVARSAHGRLLASSPGSYRSKDPVVVWDMATGDPVANITKSANVDILSMAFNWRGDELWIQAFDRSRRMHGIMIWQIPNALKDAADSRNVPDQAVIGTEERWRR